MAVSLTEGALEAIFNGNSDLHAVVQVAEVRLVKASNNTSERYRLLLSDGVHLLQGMLATQLNELIKCGQLQKGSILMLIQYVCNAIHGKKIIIMIEIKLLQEVCPTIGNPVHFGQTNMMAGNMRSGNPPPSGGGPLQQPKLEYSAPKPSSVNNMDSGRYMANNAPSMPKPEFAVGNSGNSGGSFGGIHNARVDASRTPSTYTRPQQPGYQQPGYQQPSSMYMNRGPIAKNEAPQRIIPIAALNPYQGRWTIKARVTSKGELRHYNNTRGDGKVFSFDLLDSDGGEIRVTCFNAVADQFFDQIELGKVYKLSKGSLKQAQKSFNHLANDYEIFLDITSVVQPCFEDDSRIPKQQFHFRPISEIESLDTNSVVDVIGVVFSISPCSSIMRKNGTETQKRTLHLKDMSGKSIELTLWGNFCNAEGQTLQNMCDSGTFPVLAVKAVRVSEFNGKGVGTLSNSQLFIEPDYPEARSLREWFDRDGKNTPCVSISREMTSMVRTDVRKTLSQIKDEKLGTSEKPDWITVCATLSFMKLDNFCYTACPIIIGDRQCNKKVTNNGDGKWRCERCDQFVDECDYRYILQIQIQDHTSITWVTAFQECGEEILGISAKNLFYLKYEDQDDEKVSEIIQAASFKRYVFKLKVKEETFSDEQRVKSTVVKAEKADFGAESRVLLDLIAKLKEGDNGGQFSPKFETNTSGVSLPSAYSTGVVESTSGPPNSTNECFKCRRSGHFARDCPGLGSVPLAYGGGNNIGTSGRFAGMQNQQHIGGVPNSTGECFKCRRSGHFARDCPGLGSVPPAYGRGE